MDRNHGVEASSIVKSLARASVTVAAARRRAFVKLAWESFSPAYSPVLEQKNKKGELRVISPRCLGFKSTPPAAMNPHTFNRLFVRVIFVSIVDRGTHVCCETTNSRFGDA